ncbi:hypothetical protein THRCLA_21139 [Thraustotheca clavata]|uniref:Uncharacterized protein n=1 Tax=Thraustotheca clavata TaxID=74557 RepID=A0A1V9ZZT1_9STRA|nr:hypothetical protein THRCLA_21139 [Thraustotheca clavata]
MTNWDNISDLHPTIFTMANTLTKYLNGSITHPDTNTKQQIWYDAFEENWNGDLNILPKTIVNARTFARIKSKEIYDRCLKYFYQSYDIPDSGTNFYPQEYKLPTTHEDFCRGAHIPHILAAAMENIWLHQLQDLLHYPVALAYACVDQGHLQFLQYLEANYGVDVSRLQNFYSGKGLAMDIAAYHNDLDMPVLTLSAAAHGHFRIIKWLAENRLEGCTSHGLLNALNKGHIEIVEYMENHFGVEFKARAMELAAMDGHFNTIKFLHERRQVQCTTDAMNYAATYGHLEIAKYLHIYREEGCTLKAMNYAATHRHFEIVKVLHKYRSEGCTKTAMPLLSLAMDEAAARGHLCIIEFLHENRSEGCTARAIDEASTNGFLDIVQFLRENRSEGYTATAIEKANKNGHTQVISYLLEDQFAIEK